MSLTIHRLEHRNTPRLATDPYTGFGETGNGWDIVNWIRDNGGQAWGDGGDLYIRSPRRRGRIWIAVGDRVALRSKDDFYRLEPDVYDDEFDNLGPVPS